MHSWVFRNRRRLEAIYPVTAGTQVSAPVPAGTFPILNVTLFP